MFDAILFRPILNLLMVFLRPTGNLGLAIIAMTILVRGLLLPLTRGSSQAAQKMTSLQGELEKLKKKYKNDKRKLQEEQLKLYRKHGVNPAAGCLPQIVQLVMLIGLFQVFNAILRPNGNPIELINQKVYFSFLKFPAGASLSTRFLYLDLARPDLIKLPFSVALFGRFSISRILGPFLLLAALLQLVSSKMMMPMVKTEEKIAKETKEKSDDFATMMQEQMLYTFPLMTLLIGARFPSGLVLYWLTFSAFLIIDQYRRQGWGGLEEWIRKIKR
jgi:YidC/Oxa1 family membrane protein insertase